MRAISILLAALATACSSVHERAECAAGGECPAGSYCARTPDGDVCWPDAAAPTVEAVSVTCAGGGTPCLRSGALRVEATVADDAEVAAVEVSLLGSAVPLSRAAGDVWTVDLPLARFPFPAFEAEVVATVIARDAARNETIEPAGAVTVTRRWFSKTLDAGVFSLTTPAVMEDGTVVMGGTNGKVYFVAWDGTATSVSVGTGQITAAPLALDGSVWIGSEDNSVYEVRHAVGGSLEALERADVGSPIRCSLSASQGRIIAAPSQNGFVFAVTSTGYMHSAPGVSTMFGTVVDESDVIFLVSAGMVRRFTWVHNAPTLDPSFAVTVGASVSVPLGLGSTLLVSADNDSQGFLKEIVAPDIDPLQLATTGVPSAGVAVAAGGDILVPETTQRLTRWSATGDPVESWTPAPLGADPRTPLVLGSGTARFIVSTAGGAVYALRADGTIAWSAQLGTAALQPGNIYTPPGQRPGEVTSVAYFAGADGVLHAVMVDGALDGDAPWPKAFHDPQNTNRAGPQP